MEQIFELQREKKWDEIIEILKNDKNNNINVNHPDKNGNYIMSYAILFDVIDLIKELIKKNVLLDILDIDDRSLLYHVIKYDYMETLEYLLMINKKNIGVSLLDFRDKYNNIPLHYAIITKNIQAVQILLKYDSNPNITDNYGNNALHLAIYSRNYEIFITVLKYNVNINQVTKIGETALHIACNLQEIEIVKHLLKESNINLNIQDKEYEFTPLHYSINLNNTEQIKLLLNGGANPNIQDKYGNSIIHYCIIEKNVNAFSEIIKYNVNVNTWNIYGKIPLHLVFDLGEKNHYNHNLSVYFDFLIQHSNLNIQNIEGNSCLHYIIKLNVWEKYIKVLQKKKLDITLYNNEGKRPFDYLRNKNDCPEFIELIVDSYMNRLTESPNKWMTEWENTCAKELQKTNNDNNKNKCRDTVKKKIEKIFNGKEERYKCSQKSYPVKHGYICVNLEKTQNVGVCTFTGSTLDILLGLIFILKKHKNTCSTLNANFHVNKELEKMYNDMGIVVNSRNEFLNFEIIWIQNKLIFNTDFSDSMNKCIHDKNKRYIIIPLGIELKEGSHANYLIYDKEKKEIERFEPNGSSMPLGFNYNNNLLDTILQNKFKSYDKDIVYVSPKSYLPKIGFQIFDMYENKKKIGDPGGFCAPWSIWYVDMRLSHDIDRKSLVHVLLQNIKENNISFKNVIRNYSFNIIKIRDQILSKADTDINDWINDEITDVQFNKIIENIQLLI